jgi:hypothetical protein
VASEGIRVTAHDMETGEQSEAVIQPGQYVLIAAEPLYQDSVIRHRNGTVVITLKRREAGRG